VPAQVVPSRSVKPGQQSPEQVPKLSLGASAAQSGGTGHGSIGLPVHVPGVGGQSSAKQPLNTRPGGTPRGAGAVTPLPDGEGRPVRQSSASIARQSSASRWNPCQPPSACPQASPPIQIRTAQSPPPGNRPSSLTASSRMPQQQYTRAGVAAEFQRNASVIGFNRNSGSCMSMRGDVKAIDSDQGSTSDAYSGFLGQLEAFKEEQERRFKFLEVSLLGQLQDQTKKNKVLETFIKEQLEKVVNTTTGMSNSFDERWGAVDAALQDRQASINKLVQKQQAQQKQLEELLADNRGPPPPQAASSGGRGDGSWAKEREVVLAAVISLRETVQQMKPKVEEQARRAKDVQDVIGQLQVAVPQLAAAASKYDELKLALMELRSQVTQNNGCAAAATGGASTSSLGGHVWPSFGARHVSGDAGALDISMEVPSTALDETSRSRVAVLPDSIRQLASQKQDGGGGSPVSLVASAAIDNFLAEAADDQSGGPRRTQRLSATAGAEMPVPCFGEQRSMSMPMLNKDATNSLVDIWRKDLEQMRAELKVDVSEMLQTFQKKQEDGGHLKTDLTELLLQQHQQLQEKQAAEGYGHDSNSSTAVIDALNLTHSRHGESQDTVIFHGCESSSTTAPPQM